jgi:hypothetical protein
VILQEDIEMFNTYLKILKCISSDYNRIPSKDSNTIYFITDTQQIFIGEKEYITPDVFIIPESTIKNIFI